MICDEYSELQRMLGHTIAAPGPVVRVVEDDEFARMRVGRALDPQACETMFAPVGPRSRRQRQSSR